MTRSWWTKATTPQRLRQIDEALSIGLTCEQARIICECSSKSGFTSFCAYHNRRFGRDHTAVNAKVRDFNVISNRRRRGLSEIERDEAFSVFDGNQTSGFDAMFDLVLA